LGHQFELPNQYEVMDTIGTGAYGVVVSAKDLDSENEGSDLVAIKKIEKTFDHNVFA